MTTSITRRYRGHGGVELVGDEAGPADAPIVLFLHGGGQTRHSWHGSAGRLAEHGFRTIALDARGHGESGWSPDGDYSIDIMVEDLLAIADGLGAPVALVGASMGGLTSLLAAGGMGSRSASASAVVLVDVAPQLNSEGTAKIGAFMSGNPEGFASLEEVAETVSAYMPHRPRPKDPSGLLKNLRLVDGRYYWHWDPAFLGGKDFGRSVNNTERLEAAARAVTAPMLLVRGGASDVVSVEGAQALLAIKPEAEYVDVAGAHHMVAGDRNDAFGTAVEEFLHRVMAG